MRYRFEIDAQRHREEGRACFSSLSAPVRSKSIARRRISAALDFAAEKLRLKTSDIPAPHYAKWAKLVVSGYRILQDRGLVKPATNLWSLMIADFEQAGIMELPHISGWLRHSANAPPPDRMRIMIVMGMPPSRFFGGGIANYHLAKGLALMHEVSIISKSPKTVHELAVVDDLEASGVRCYFVPGPSTEADKKWRAALVGSPDNPHHRHGMQRLIDRAFDESDTDVIILSGLSLSCYRYPTSIPLVLYAHVVESDFFRSRAEANLVDFDKLVFARRAQKQRLLEPLLYDRFNLIASVSPADANLIRSQTKVPVIVSPVGIDINWWNDSEDEHSSTRGAVVFVGSSHPLNREAAAFLIYEVMPRLRYHYPDARLVIVGSVRQDFENVALPARVYMTGCVADIRSYVHGAAVVVSPMLRRAGQGQSIKTSEAMAAGKAVVVSRPAANGLPQGIEENTHLLVASDNSPESYAILISELLSDREQAVRLGMAGRDFMRDHGSWQVVGRCLGENIRKLLSC